MRIWITAFPSCYQGVPFKRNFMSVAKTILKRLFRVYAHIYHQHFDSVMQLQEEAHLNTSFKHFIFFVQVKKSLTLDLCVFNLVILCVCNKNREDNLISPFPLSFYRSSTSLTGKSWCHFRSWLKNWQPRIDKQQHNPYFIGLLVFAQIPTPPWLYVCSIYYISIWGNVFNNARKKEGSW